MLMHTYIIPYIHTHTYIHRSYLRNTYIDTYMQIQTYILQMHTFIHACIHANIYITYMHAYIHIHTLLFKNHIDVIHCIFIHTVHTYNCPLISKLVSSRSNSTLVSFSISTRIRRIYTLYSYPYPYQYLYFICFLYPILPVLPRNGVRLCLFYCNIVMAKA